MQINRALSTSYLTFHDKTALKMVAMIGVVLSLLLLLHSLKTPQKHNDSQTRAIITAPQIKDIYFFDNKQLNANTRPYENIRIAKVIDITGDIVSIIYGDFLYPNHYSTVKGIKYSQLSYPDYFQPKRFNFTIDELIAMHDSGVIYLAKRPVNNKLFDRAVGPEYTPEPYHFFIQGNKENAKGEAFLKLKHSETKYDDAYELFTQSAQLGFAKGQVNLAQMYLNGLVGEPDFTKTLYWLKQASLQSHKPAIYKYRIVCKQVVHCDINQFYYELVEAGVKIQVNDFEFKLSNSN